MTNRTLLLLLLLLPFVGRAQQYSGALFAPNDIDWGVRGEIIERKPLLAIKTNLLFDIGSAVNIEVEVPIRSRFSLSAEWIFPWWLDTKHQRCFETLYAEVQGRYWFDEHPTDHPLNGWFAGVYFGGGYYDIEWKRDGAQGELWSYGVCGGYTHRVWRDLRMEYAINLGLIDTKYDKYDALQSCTSNSMYLYREASGRYKWWGITKIEVSLVWMLNRVRR